MPNWLSPDCFPVPIRSPSESKSSAAKSGPRSAEPEGHRPTVRAADYGGRSDGPRVIDRLRSTSRPRTLAGALRAAGETSSADLPAAEIISPETGLHPSRAQPGQSSDRDAHPTPPAAGALWQGVTQLLDQRCGGGERIKDVRLADGVVLDHQAVLVAVPIVSLQAAQS